MPGRLTLRFCMVVVGAASGADAGFIGQNSEGGPRSCSARFIPTGAGTRDGSDAAIQAAQDMIAAGAAWIGQEYGPDEACRVLQVVEASQRVSGVQGRGKVPSD
jgi:hypothetical protein